MTTAFDQCTHCIVKGHLPTCERTACTYHNLWYVKELKKKIKKMTEIVDHVSTDGALVTPELQEAARKILGSF